MHSFAGLIRRTPPPTFSDTAITDRHSDTTIFQLRAHWVRISWSIGSEKSFGHVPPGGSRTLDFLHARRAPDPLGQALRSVLKLSTVRKLYTGHLQMNVRNPGRDISSPIFIRKEIETRKLERKSKQKISRLIDLLYRLNDITSR